ncbi:Hsc70-interacting protein, partial [Trichinella pseudospiralis]
MIPTEQVNLLRSFVQQCKKYPSLLHNPRISFYKEYLESLGATIPPAQTDNAANNAQAGQKDKSSSESELEFSDADVMEPEEEMSLPFGDESVELTEEMIVNCDVKQQKAMEAAKKGDYEQALKLYSEAICLNPLSTLLYGRRAWVLLNLKKPMTAIRDCTKAINLNPNAAIAYKYRGKAYRMLGRWEDAYYDLCNANNLDYNEECYQWLKEVEEYAKKIFEHKRKKERNMGGNMPDLSDFNFGNIMSDPEIMEALKDPELIKVFDDVKKNPMNLLKYQSNPKISKMLAKLQSMFTPSSGQSGKKKDDNDDRKDGKSGGASMFADTNLD